MSALEHERQPPRRPPPTLAAVRDPDGDESYPVHLLRGTRSALVLFCAAFYGRQDAIHVHDAGMTATCVDSDEERLTEMMRVYPRGWDFVVDDAYQFAAQALGERAWDVVSLDPFSQDFERCLSLLDLWCTLARHVVILGVHHSAEVTAPHGWELAGRYHRSDFLGGVQWAGLLRA